MHTQTLLLTGASGFLASHILLKLLNEGYNVRGSVRSMAKGDHIRTVMQTRGADTTRLSFVELDLTSDAGWDDAMTGVDYLIHTASPFVTGMPKNPDDLVQPAVQGTRRALTAALKSGVKRIVLTSSMVAACHGHDKTRTTPYGESDWTNPDGADVTPYILSKTLAEREAWSLMEAANRRDDLTVINPGFILGPVLEQDIGTSGAIVKRLMLGQLPGCPRIFFSVVDVRDAAELHVLAMHDPAGFGHRVFAADAPVEFVELAKILKAGFPEFAPKMRARRLPDFVVRLVALYDRDVKTAAMTLGRQHNMDISLATPILGRPLISTQDAALAMANSMIDLGLLAP
jgi:dihydroflavonol-4-reductase